MKTGNVILAIFLFVFGGFGIIYGIAFSIFGLITAPIGGAGILAGGGVCLIISIIFIILGIVVLITGIENKPLKSEQKIIIEKQPPLSQPVQSSVPSSIRYCPKCGRQIPFDAVVCPYCQYDFK